MNHLPLFTSGKETKNIAKIALSEMLAEGNLKSRAITQFAFSMYQGNAVCSFSNIYSSSRGQYNQEGSDIIKIDADDTEEGPDHRVALENLVNTYIQGNPPEIGFEMQLRLYGINFIKLEADELGRKMWSYNLRPKVYSIEHAAEILDLRNLEKGLLAENSTRSTFTVPQIISVLRKVIPSTDIKVHVNNVLKGVAIYESMRIAEKYSKESV